MYHGDIRLGDTLDIKFTTRQISGAPSTLGGTPVISAYVGNGTTQITAGITLTVDFDGVTGLNNVRVVATSGNGYATATNVQLVITTGTVNSVSVVGEVIATFSIEARSALMPTTAARTLVVDAAGLADANVVKVGPTGSGTAQTAKDIGAAVPAAAAGASGGLLISGSNSGTTTFGALTVTGATTLTGAVSLGSTLGITGTTTLAALTCTTLTATTNAIPWNASWDTEVQSEVNDGLIAFWTSPATLVDLVWDEPTSGHSTAGTTGKALTDAGSAGDPWATALPGAYSAGTAGKIVGDNINAPIGTVDTVVDAIKAVTDNLPNSGTLSSLATASALATVDTVVDSILVDTAEIGAAGAGLTALATQASVNDLPTNAELATAITTGLTTALTEGYRGTGATGSVRDLLYELLANITEFTISGTTKTVKKLDASTTAKTYTLNDGTTPTGITETT